MNVTNSFPVAFASKIKFVSDQEFKDRTAHHTRHWNNKQYIADPWDDVAIGSEALTDNIFGCNAGGLTNTVSKDVVMFHYKPLAVTYPKERFQDKIYNALGQMGQYTEKLGGLIIGGKTAGSGDNNYENSKTLSEKLEELMHNVKASITKFWGQKVSGGHTNLFYSGAEDTWYVNYTEGASYYHTNSIQTPDDIKRAYFGIEVSDNDQVFIGEQQVDKFDLIQGYTRVDGGYELDLKPQNPAYQPQYDYSDQKWKDRTKVNLFLANYGQDPRTLWVEQKADTQIQEVLHRIEEIKKAPLFRDVQKLQYAGQLQLPGFREISDSPDGKKVFEKSL